MKTLVVKTGQLIVKTGTILPEGMLQIEDGKITAVGQNLSIPADAELLDYSSSLIYPGFIDACSQLGVNKEPFDYMTDTRDGSDGGAPMAPGLLAEDAFDPYAATLDMVRSNGITTIHAICGPGSLIDGQSASFKLKKAETSADMRIPHSRQMCFTVGDLPVKGSAPMHKPPMTRMSAASMLRSKLSQARQALEKGTEETADPDTRALIPVLKKEQKARFYCHAAQDLAMAVSLGEEFHLDYVLSGGFEAWKLPEFWKAHPAPFLLAAIPFGPMMNLISTWYDFSLNNAGVLFKAGCPLALTASEVTHTARLPYMAGYLSTRGLDPEAALRSITEVPARILGLADRIGTLEVEKDADFTVWNGDALLSTSRCLASYIEGTAVYEA